MEKNAYKAHCKCRLCGGSFKEEDMSDEHYPARSVGNEDIVGLDLIKLFDFLMSNGSLSEIRSRIDAGDSIQEVASDIFDSKLSTPLFPDGRTAKHYVENVILS